MRRFAITFLATAIAAAGFVSAAEAERSTWPVIHGDQGNSKSRDFAGPEKLRQAWYSLPMRPPGVVVAVSPTGERYTVTMDEGPCHLWALDTAGETLWCSDRIGP